jgi:hypothetical protein
MPNETKTWSPRSRHTASLNSRTAVELLLCPLPHEVQCHTGRRAGIRELHFVGSNGRDDPALIRACTHKSIFYKRGSFNVRFAPILLQNSVVSQGPFVEFDRWLCFPLSGN